MAFTPKQVRQGTDMGADGHNSAVANQADMVEVPIEAAQAAAAAYSDQGRQVFDGGGFEGVVPFDWDAGLAIAEEPGEM